MRNKIEHQNNMPIKKLVIISIILFLGILGFSVSAEEKATSTDSTSALQASPGQATSTP